MTGVPPILFDAAARLQRQECATRRGGDFLWLEAGEGIWARLLPVTQTFSSPLAVDGRAGKALPLRPDGWRLACFDAQEKLQIQAPCDLAVSVLSLHALNDLPGALRQIRMALKPGGLFLAAVFGGATLYELRDSLAAGDAAAGNGSVRRLAPAADVRDLGALLLRAGFAMPVADMERTTVRYQGLETLICDLRNMGETGILAGPRPPFGKCAYAAAKAHYAAHYAGPDGKLRATFDIVYLTGWALKRTFKRPPS